ncbi:MAG: hypothetical protein CMD83_12650 [Gammaproteobacteria bacterium]|nr:hypothetical protein [Gammaproteobacteria bacterium]
MNVLVPTKDMMDANPGIGTRYWRIGVSYAAVTGVAFGLVTWIIASDPVPAAAMGTLFGLLAGGCAGAATWLGERRIREGGYPVDRSPSVRQELDVTVDPAPGELFEVCPDVLESLDDVAVETRNIGQLKLVGQIGPSWRSFGEHVQIIVREIAPSRSRVWILSRPTLRPAVIDCGKNLENAISIRDALQTSLECPAKPSAAVPAGPDSALRHPQFKYDRARLRQATLTVASPAPRAKRLPPLIVRSPDEHPARRVQPFPVRPT